MATYSLNTTVAFAGAIGVTGTPSASYTVPANCYAIVQLVAQGTGNGTANISGVSVGLVASGAGGALIAHGIYAGAGQTITVTGAGGGPSGHISGALFTNTP